MMTQPDRRSILAGGAAAGFSALAGPGLAQPGTVRLGPPQPFSFDGLVARARAAAGRAYTPPSAGDPGLAGIDFDAYGQITYDPAMTIWGAAGEPAVRLFPLGGFFRTPVQIHLIDQGRSRQVIYESRLFQAPGDSAFRKLKGAGGFAGFRVMNPEGGGDWLAFLGASYFRTAGAFNQYGASARALAINSGGPAPEEFPWLSEFWLERAPQGGLIAYALLDGPSVSGAFRFDNRRMTSGVIQTVEAALFFRQPVETLGIAPMTSMFWYDELDPPAHRDWRPQIHDSDGLALWTGAGERIWRPLSNPPRVVTNAFQDDNPKGFGLSQRDRIFDHYQDDGAFYDKRPSLWIEPTTPFGAGSVRLVQIPSNSETDDNIVAFWTPNQPVKAGSSFHVGYRINWIDHDPRPGRLARVVATRIGEGGRPGLPSRPGYRRIDIDFEGDALNGLTRGSGVEAVVTASDGSRIDQVAAYPVVGTPFWRVLFDIGGVEHGPVDLRAYLRQGSSALSETWVYQLFPEK
jgi:periplasmic glucans biosynthesis protein